MRLQATPVYFGHAEAPRKKAAKPHVHADGTVCTHDHGHQDDQHDHDHNHHAHAKPFSILALPGQIVTWVKEFFGGLWKDLKSLLKGPDKGHS